MTDSQSHANERMISSRLKPGEDNYVKSDGLIIQYNDLMKTDVINYVLSSLAICEQEEDDWETGTAELFRVLHSLMSLFRLAHCVTDCEGHHHNGSGGHSGHVIHMATRSLTANTHQQLAFKGPIYMFHLICDIMRHSPPHLVQQRSAKIID